MYNTFLHIALPVNTSQCEGFQHGMHRKDTHLSSSMDYAMEIMQLSWIARKAAMFQTHMQVKAAHRVVRLTWY